MSLTPLIEDRNALTVNSKKRPKRAIALAASCRMAVTHGCDKVRIAAERADIKAPTGQHIELRLTQKIHKRFILAFNSCHEKNTANDSTTGFERSAA